MQLLFFIEAAIAMPEFIHHEPTPTQQRSHIRIEIMLDEDSISTRNIHIAMYTYSGYG